MPSNTNSLKKTPLVTKNNLAGFEYPEIFVMVITTAIIYVWLDFQISVLILLIITLIAFIAIVFLSYRRGYNAFSDLSSIAVMAMIAGFTKLYGPILISVLLLSGIRLILSFKHLHVTLVIIMVLMTGVCYLLNIILSIPDIQLSQSRIFIIVGSSLLAAWWEFWNIYTYSVAANSEAKKSKQRLVTMVSIISKLNRFIPPQVWKPIVKNDSPVMVFNKRAKLTVMFSDIVGFTKLSDTLSSDNLAEILNTYMESMTLIANRHGAVLDKFIGDGMVCFFGEPKSNGVRDDALACVAMAIDMRREMRTLRHQWRLQGFDGLYIRIGIHTGYCHVGNFGSSNRLNYTLIGRTVNLTSRLEGAANKGTILISQDTYDYVNYDFACMAKGALDLKGFDTPILCYEVLDPEEKQGVGSKWIDQDLPGFNLQLNFKDIKNYDYRTIKAHLNLALEQVEKAEGVNKE